MADDELSRILNGSAPTGAESVPAGNGQDEFSKLLHGEGMPEPENKVSEAGIQDAVGETSPPKDTALSYLLNNGKEQPGYLQLLTEGVHRGYVQAKAAIPSLKSVGQDLSGDTAGAAQSAAEAQTILKEASDPYWEFKNISNPDDFLRWTTEKVGEQAVNIGAMMMTGGLGWAGAAALTSNLLSRGLITQATARSIQTAGTLVPSYVTSTGMETAGTTQEQFDVTGSPQGALSLGAGATKGLLELWGPLSAFRLLRGEGGGIISGTLKTMAKEGSTEAVQELIDIAARKHSDPSYSFFGDGPDWWNGPGFSRTLESGMAGAVVGGVYGVPAALTGKRVERDPVSGEVVDKPGTRTLLPGSAGPVQEALSNPLGMQAAVRVGNQVFVGSNHNEAVDKAEQAIPDNAKIWASLAQSDENGKTINDGFVDKNGRYYTRTEAAEAVNLQSKSKILYSEHLTQGPVTELRKRVMPKGSEDKLLNEALQRDPRDDVWSVGPLIRDTFQGVDRNAVLDLLEANTPRFVELLPDGKLSSRLMTDTEIELDTAMNKPQSEKRKFLRVDQSSLQLNGITADVLDLPPFDSGRVHFLQGTTQAEAEQLRQQYEVLQEAASKTVGTTLNTKADRQKFEDIVRPIYDKLLKRGLRVVPSRGSGFYFDGLIKGEPVEDITTTGRSTQVARYNPVTQKVSIFRGGVEDLTSGLLQPGEILVSVDRNKLKPGDVTFTASGKDEFFLNKPLRPELLTPGIKIQNLGNILEGSSVVTFQLDDGVQTYMAGVLPENEEVGLQIRRVADKYKGVIEKVLKSIGLPPNLGIMVTDEDKATFGVEYASPALMWYSGGQIFFFPKNVDNWTNFGMGTGDLETNVLESIKHELGHQVTYYHYARLPTEIQGQLRYAWEKANLANRMSTDSVKADFIGNTSLAQRDYYLTFPEWLAEQFRRWMGSDAQVRSYTDQAFKEGARKLEAFYDQWEKDFGTRQHRLDMQHPDYAFSGMMEYLRGVGNEKEQLNQLMRQLAMLQVSDVLLQNPAGVRITTQVTLALKSMLDMVPEPVKFSFMDRISSKLYQSDQAVASWDPNTSLIELAVGSLARDGMTADNAYDKARVFFAHELMHSYEDLGLITPEEIRILNRDIEASPRKLPNGYEVALKRRVYTFAEGQNKAARDAGRPAPWSPERIEEKFQDMLGREKRAYYIQDFANTGVAHSAEARGIITRILAILERVRAFMKGIQYQTAEDVRRAFFKGEMVARYDRNAEAVEKSRAATKHLEVLARNENSIKAVMNEGVLSEKQIRTYLKFTPEQREAYKTGYNKVMQDVKTQLDELESGKLPSPLKLKAFITSLIERTKDLISGIEDFSGAGEITRQGLHKTYLKLKRTLEAFEKLDSHPVEKGRSGIPNIGPKQEALAKGEELVPTRTYNVGDLTVEAFYDGTGTDYKKNSSYVFYHWRDTEGNILGAIELKVRMPKGIEVAWIQNYDKRVMLAAQMIAEAEKDLGMPMLVAGELTADGRKQSMLLLKKQGKADLIPLWQQVQISARDSESGQFENREYWVSPNWVLEQLSNWSDIASSRQKMIEFSVEPKYAREQVAKYKQMYNALPKQIWTDGTLDKMFSLKKNHERDEVQGSILRSGVSADESKLLASLGQGSAREDAFTSNTNLKSHFSQAENAKATNTLFELSAPSSMLTYEAWNIKAALGIGGYGPTAQEAKEIKNLQHEADRIGWFTKRALGISQLAQINKHIRFLQKYDQLGNVMQAIAQNQMRKGDDIAKVWDKVPESRKEPLADVMFKLSDMTYLLPIERKNKTVRTPGGWEQWLLTGVAPAKGSELGRMFSDAKLTREETEIVRSVQNYFLDFLKAVEETRAKQLSKTLQRDPKSLAAALIKLQAEMNDYRKKPYFPHVRFGEYTLTVRDPNDKNRVVASYAFDTQSQRTSALQAIRKEWPAPFDFITGRVPESAHEFMGLPGPLLRAIKENMQQDTNTKLTTEQLVWMEEFEQLHAPDRSFRKRWMPSRGIEGHSMDAFRAFSHYVQSGSRYLSRLAVMDDMQEAISATENSISSGQLGDTSKRQAIVQYMKDHYRYIMEPGRDSVKFRAFFALWHLGFSPAAAAMNFTQTFTTFIPWLGQHFGKFNGYQATILRGMAALKQQNGIATGDAAFMRAREEMISQGKIDVGQAPEIAAYAEGHNLNKLSAGTRAQKFWRNFNYAGMYMFSAIEHYNRELAFKVSWDLARQYPDTARLKKIEEADFLEIATIQKNANLTHDEAVAFIFAREAIAQTQFEYSKHSDAPFMRGEYRKNFLIFFKYTQNMLFFLRYGGVTAHALLVMAFLFGLNSLPGSDEANELLRLIANKLFGKDFDLKLATRRAVREMTKGGPFDEVGPDVVMNGISRYGFGFGLAPTGWGLGSFDASANGSMGRLVPGLSEYMHGVATGREPKEVFGDSAQKAAGAGYGTTIALMHFLMSDPFTADQKKWEQILPRGARALSRAYRFGVDPAADTTKNGAKIVKFDVSDPGDMWTVLAQAAGFTPTKVSETWDLIRTARETDQIFKARRTAIYAQMDKAVQVNNPEAIRDMLDAVSRFNADVREVAPNMQIAGPAVISALRNRAKTREMQEQFLAPTKREVLITDRLRDLYPGVGAQKVK